MRRIDTEAVDQRIGQRHWRAAHRHFIEEPLLGLGKAEQAHGLPALRLGQLHLAEQRAHHEHRRHAANLRRRYASSRSEEHTSELQSLMRISYAVFCLKKKTHNEVTIEQT